MSDNRSSPVDGEEPETPEGYEPPAVRLLGTLEELTGGPVGIGGDLNGMVISF
jgi:hypothetical protein